jgi:hypothetical protein
MIKNIIISAMLALALSLPAFAEAQKEKVLVYNLEIVREQSIYDDEEGDNKEQYDYYSFIIPQAITQNLGASGVMESQKMEGILPKGDVDSEAFYVDIRKIGEEHKARYIIGGKGTIVGRKLTIELDVIDLKKREVTIITRESHETGAELRSIISDLTTEIEQKLGMHGDDRDREKSRPAPVDNSPFLRFYRAMEGLSFGVKTGRFFIKGPFSSMYEDSDYVGPYLSYGILKWLGVTAEADYIASSHVNEISRYRSTLSLWGITLNADFSYRFFSHFGVKLSGGFGASIGRIDLATSDNPFMSINRRRKSTDPYLNIAASFNLIFKPVELQFGGAYKSAFFKGTSLSLLTIFVGIGYCL